MSNTNAEKHDILSHTTRRRFITGITSLTTIGLAGCTDQIPFVGGDGPEDTVEAFWEATDSADTARLDELAHTESPARPDIANPPDDLDQFSIELESTTVVEENTDRAVVESRVTFSADGRSETDTVRIELRTENDAWKLWDIA